MGALHLQLEEFEGPLPLLLQLIERQELDITRVSITAVADQFLALVTDRLGDDLAATGEFLSIGTRLLLIKSRALLPHRGTSIEDVSGPDDAEALAQQVELYRRYRDAATSIAERLTGELFCVPRPASHGTVAYPPREPTANVPALRKAASRLLRVSPDALGVQAETWPQVDFTTVRSDLLRQLSWMREASFSTLCNKEWHPLVTITLFLAVLDAARSHALSIRQDAAYGPLDLAVLPRDA